VGALGVEFLDEVVEARLLLEWVAAWRAGCLFLQGEVHALMAAILLRMAGFDAFDVDGEPQLPDGELGQGEEPIGAGEGNAIVGPDRLGQAALAKELFECSDDGDFLG